MALRKVMLALLATCVLIGGQVSCEENDGNQNSTASESPVDCSSCPGQIYSPVNNIQITTCEESRTGESTEYNSNCSVCDDLLSLAKAQLTLTNRILNQLDDNQSYVDTSTIPPSAQTEYLPRDCAEVYSAGHIASGRYVIYPADDQDPFFVFCDMETDGGGWTVFQRRQNGSVDFYLNWLDYKYGFGSVSSEHWLGNEKIHHLTSQKTYVLRIDLEDFEGESRYAEYNQFIVADEELRYQLIIGDYRGDAGDSMTASHDGMKFSTKDRDGDTDLRRNCATTFHGAWWYKDCHDANLNGQYLAGRRTTQGQGVNWLSWHDLTYSLKKTEMKMRPLN